MRSTVAILLALLPAQVAPDEGTGRHQLFPAPEHQVLLPGTFHFKDAGLASYKPEHDVDILSDG